MSLARNIKKYRRKYHLSQDDLAEACFVARCTISNWEAGRRTPNYESIVVLARLFGITIDELLQDENGINPNSNENKSDFVLLENSNDIHTELITNNSNEILPLSNSRYKKFNIQAAIILTILVTIMAVGIPTAYFIMKYKQEPLCLEEIESVKLEILDLSYDNIYYFELYEKVERSKNNVDQNSVEKEFVIRELDLSRERFIKFWTKSPEIIKFQICIYFHSKEKQTLNDTYKFQNIITESGEIYNHKDYFYVKEYGIYQMNLRLRSGSCNMNIKLIR